MVTCTTLFSEEGTLKLFGNPLSASLAKAYVEEGSLGLLKYIAEPEYIIKVIALRENLPQFERGDPAKIAIMLERRPSRVHQQFEAAATPHVAFSDNPLSPSAPATPPQPTIYDQTSENDFQVELYNANHKFGPTVESSKEVLNIDDFTFGILPEIKSDPIDKRQDMSSLPMRPLTEYDYGDALKSLSISESTVQRVRREPNSTPRDSTRFTISDYAE